MTAFSSLLPICDIILCCSQWIPIFSIIQFKGHSLLYTISIISWEIKFLFCSHSISRLKKNYFESTGINSHCNQIIIKVYYDTFLLFSGHWDRCWEYRLEENMVLTFERLILIRRETYLNPNNESNKVLLCSQYAFLLVCLFS